MSDKTAPKKKVVIVGGGAAGASLARSLSASLDASKHDLILINSRPYNVHLIATARMVVSDQEHLEDSAFIPYDKLFYNGNGTFVHGTVTAIHAGEKGGKVILADNRAIPYDLLVLAPGSKWPGPLSIPNDAQQVPAFLQNTRAKFQDATHVVIAGGGAVGMEIAGEIKDIWPDKKVTIVHAGPRLLNSTYPDSFRTAAELSVRARGIDVILGDYIDNIPDAGVVAGITTRNGIAIDADLVVSARGPRPNTAFISTLGPDILTKNGFVRVKPTLQLKGYPNIFVGGDAIDFPEQKQAGKAGKHAGVIAANLVRYLDGKALQEYRGSTEMIAITNGRKGGIGYFDVLWGVTIGNWLTRLLKSRNLMVSFARARLGQ